MSVPTGRETRLVNPFVVTNHFKIHARRYVAASRNFVLNLVALALLIPMLGGRSSMNNSKEGSTYLASLWIED